MRSKISTADLFALAKVGEGATYSMDTAAATRTQTSEEAFYGKPMLSQLEEET